MFLLGTPATVEGQHYPGCQTVSRVVAECDQRCQPLKPRLRGQGNLHQHLGDLHLTCIQLPHLHTNCVREQISKSNAELLLQGDSPLQIIILQFTCRPFTLRQASFPDQTTVGMGMFSICKFSGGFLPCHNTSAMLFSAAVSIDNFPINMIKVP